MGAGIFPAPMLFLTGSDGPACLSLRQWRRACRLATLAQRCESGRNDVGEQARETSVRV